MTDEMPTWDGTPGVGIYTNKYIKTKTTSWLLVHSDSWPSSPSTWLFDPANFDESTWDWYISFLRPYLIPTEFIPLGIDFTQLATYLNNNLQSLYPFFPTNTTVTKFGLGFTITIPSSYLENIAQRPAGSLKNVELNMQYPKDGVCGPLRYRYGLTLFEFGLVSEGGEEIPGYTLSIILGTGAVGIISLIYIIRRKDRLE